MKTIATAALALLLFTGLAPQTTAPPPPAVPTASTSNCLAPPTVSSTTPADMALTRQADANCFAWQEFISLSWTASKSMRGQPDTNVPASKFGEPLDPGRTVWETYKEAAEVFLPDAKNPGPWNSPLSDIRNYDGQESKFEPDPPLDLSSVGQASLGHPWLTAQSRILTLYDRRMNEDEFNYIVQNKLYDATVQQTFAVSPGINLPDGTANTSQYGPLGAIETKAAWIELPRKEDWKRFKIARANVCYPSTAGGKCSVYKKNVVVGLVGLHIIHKTALGQQFIWATFEHIDNAPNQTEVASGKLPRSSYTYYDPKCDPKTDYYQCTANANPVTYKGARKPNPLNAPIQVVRTTDIPTRANDNVVGLNEYVWNQIRAANPDSVFLNYQLVNVLWSNQNTPIQVGARTPLIAAQMSPGPSQEPVSNTTMETYVQSLTCITCHANAPIAPVKPPRTIKIVDPAKSRTPETAQNSYASDYSFLFNNAKQPRK
jgi:hypothetical protein